jgi:hypothetical protein
MKVNPLLEARGVMSVEDWAEIRRLHLAEGIPDQGDREDA